MRFLVLGAGGMAGHMVTIYLTERGHDVTGFSRKPLPFCPCIVGDVTHFEQLNKLIQKGEYDVVINCIGLLNQFAENQKEQAVYVNAFLPHFLADITRCSQTQIIQMSTDCVFSGFKGNYTEEDIPDGQTFYDRTKALGELKNDKNLTFRNSIIGPDMHESGIGLLNWFMRQKNTITGYTGVKWNGLTTLELAKIMESAVAQKAKGLHQIVYDQPISKFHLLQLCNRYLKDDALTIIETDHPVSDKSLIRTTHADFEYTVPDYDTMIRELTQWIREHKGLYPHYEQ